MVKKVGICSFLVALALCSGSLFGSSFPQTRQIKVLTYNIHHCNPPSVAGLINLQAIAEVIKKSNADLVALQEVDVFTARSGKSVHQAKELGRITGMYYHFVKGIDYEGGEYGVAILSKFPFLKTDSLRLPMKEGAKGEPRVMATAIVEPFKGIRILFASTHLELKEDNRVLQASAICRELRKSKYPVILGGDFNAVPGSSTMDIFDADFTRSSLSGPSGFTIPVVNPNREIDFLMTRKKDRLTFSGHVVIQEQYASDHLPVLVNVSF